MKSILNFKNIGWFYKKTTLTRGKKAKLVRVIYSYIPTIYLKATDDGHRKWLKIYLFFSFTTIFNENIAMYIYKHDRNYPTTRSNICTEISQRYHQHLDELFYFFSIFKFLFLFIQLHSTFFFSNVFKMWKKISFNCTICEKNLFNLCASINFCN